MDTMEKIEYIIQLIGDVTMSFYQNKLNEGYQKLEQLISVIGITMTDLPSDHVMKLIESKINIILTDALNAMEEQDSLLLADIMEYELKEEFKKLL